MSKTYTCKRIEEDQTILVTDSRGSSVAMFEPDGTEPEWFQQLGPQSKNLVEKQVDAFVRGDTPVATSAGEKPDSRRSLPRATTRGGNDSKKEEEEGEKKKKTFKSRTCKLKTCGVEFTPTGSKQDYCSVEHRLEDKRPVDDADKKKNKTRRVVIPVQTGIQPRILPAPIPASPFRVEINPVLAPVEEIEGTIKLAGGFIFAGRVVITGEGIILDGILQGNNE